MESSTNMAAVLGKSPPYDRPDVPKLRRRASISSVIKKKHPWGASESEC